MSLSMLKTDEEKRKDQVRQLRLQFSLGLRRDSDLILGTDRIRCAEHFIEEMSRRSAVVQQFAYAMQEAAHPGADDASVGRAIRRWMEMNLDDLAEELADIESGIDRATPHKVAFSQR